MLKIFNRLRRIIKTQRDKIFILQNDIKNWSERALLSEFIQGQRDLYFQKEISSERKRTRDICLMRADHMSELVDQRDKLIEDLQKELKNRNRAILELNQLLGQYL